MSLSEPIHIISAKRTPIGSFQGVFQHTPATQLGTSAIQGCLDECPQAATQIEHAYLGCVLPAGLGQAPARQAILGAGLPNTIACTTINKVCGSSMQSILFAFNTIAAQQAHCILCGGFENMSQSPFLIPNARQGFRLGHQKILDHMMHDGLEDAYQQGRSMAFFAEECASTLNITRAQQDQFAISSLQRAKKATENGLFTHEIHPVATVQKRTKQMIKHDQGPEQLDPNKIERLHPLFKESGTITAANASSISDGGAALILASNTQCQQLGLTPLATLKAQYSVAHEPAKFTTAPIHAIEGVLKAANWGIEEVDLFEINEAFAVVTLACMNALNIPHDKVNIHGGACSLGHPIGATGARIVVTLIHALKQHGLHRGVASLCIGGGEAIALAIEIND